MNIVEKFLNYQKYKNNPEFVGVILYGSYLNNLNNEHSDIDIIIIFDSNNKTEIKGIKKIKDIDGNVYKFEYFERNLSNLYKRVERDISNIEDSSLSILGHGKIIHDKENKIKMLQEYTKKKFEKDWPIKLSENEKIYLLIDLNKSIEYLKILNTYKDPYFNIYYGIVLNKIRIFYNKDNGYSKIGTSKVYKIYNNKKIAKLQHRLLPPQKFIKLFNNCVIEKQEEIKLNNIIILFNYITKNQKINFDDIKVNLDGKEY